MLKINHHYPIKPQRKGRGENMISANTSSYTTPSIAESNHSCRKDSNQLKKMSISHEKAALYIVVIQQFLERNPKVPKFISIEDFILYLTDLDDTAVEAMMLFYKGIRNTSNYLLEIQRIQLLNKLVRELKLKNYNDR